MTIIKLPEKFNEYDPETLKHLQDVYLMMLKVEKLDFYLVLHLKWGLGQMFKIELQQFII